MRILRDYFDSSAVTLVTGLVLLVFVASGASYFIHNRLSNTSQKAELQNDAIIADAHLAQLTSELRILNLKHAEHAVETRESQKQAQLLSELEQKSREQSKKISLLQSVRQSLDSEIPDLEKSFQTYRSDYQQKIRLAAKNEQHGELKTRTGRVYQKVTIVAVTAEGIEFTHEHGISRLAKTALDSSWHERFQWDAN